MPLRLVVLTVVALATSGCATLFASKTVPLQVDSVPAGAEVFLDGTVRGKTPMVLELNRSKKATVEVALSGYEKGRCNTAMGPGLGWILADTAVCAIPLSIFLFVYGSPLLVLPCVSYVDAIGSWNELSEPSCRVTLMKSAGGPPGLEPAPGTVPGPGGNYPPPPTDGAAYPPPPPSGAPGATPDGTAYPPPP